MLTCSRTLQINNNNQRAFCLIYMNNDMKSIKSVAEEAIEAILAELEQRGIKVFRLQVFANKERPPQVNIVIDEMGGKR